MSWLERRRLSFDFVTIVGGIRALYRQRCDCATLIPAYPASLTRILLLDLAMFTLQITALTISYITNHGKAIPTTSSFPHDDLLLPPEGEFPLDSDESDLESGILNRRSVRARSGVDSGSNELWLDDDEDDYKPGQGSECFLRLGEDFS